MINPKEWTQPDDWYGQLPGARPATSWKSDETQMWPAEPRQPEPQEEYDWRQARPVRLALLAFCLASVCASLALIAVSVRVVVALWPR